MTDREICRMYRNAKNKNKQLQILAELNGTGKDEIIRILAKNKEELTECVINHLYKRLDVLDKQISEKEKEYREIVWMLNGSKMKNRR